MGYTLKELSELTGVSKQTCWRYVKKHEISPIKKLDNGANVYPEKVFYDISQEYNSYTTSKTSGDETVTIEILQQQLDVKDQQIEKLQQLLDQQQQLNLNTSRLLENKAKESHAKPQNDTTDNNSDNSTKTQEKTSESAEATYKGNIFSRLFRNK